MLAKKKPIRISTPDSSISEQFREIRTNIFFSSIDDKNQTLLVTSPGFNEGKTTAAIHLAMSMALQGDRILLIEADLRRPIIQTAMKLNKECGLIHVLKGEMKLEDAVCETEIQNLFVLTSGPTPYNPAELLSSQQMKEVVEKAKEQFDFILFDSPPVLEVTDARILAHLCDGVLLVLNKGKTKGERALEAKRLLNFARANILGVIMNQKK